MANSSSAPRVATLGSGIFAVEAHLPAIAELQSSNSLNLVANWSRSSDSAEKYKSTVQKSHGIELDVYHGEDGLKELLGRSDIDAVIIALPITTQPKIVQQCLDAGKHVLSEKPIAQDVKLAQQLIEKYEATYVSKNLVWEIAEQFYYEPRYLRVKQIIDSGKLGRITFFTQNCMMLMEEGSKYHATSWRTVPEYQGGFLLDGGVHFVAGIANMLGPIERVTGSSSLTREYLAPADTLTAICKTESGIHGTVTISVGAAPTLRALNTIISGEHGHIELAAGPGDWTLTTHIKDEAPQVEMFPSRGVFHEIEHFAQTVAAVKAGSTKAESSTIRRAIKDVAFIEACVDGSNTERRISDV